MRRLRRQSELTRAAAFTWLAWLDSFELPLVAWRTPGLMEQAEQTKKTQDTVTAQ